MGKALQLIMCSISLKGIMRDFLGFPVVGGTGFRFMLQICCMGWNVGSGVLPIHAYMGLFLNRFSLSVFVH